MKKSGLSVGVLRFVFCKMMPNSIFMLTFVPVAYGI